MTAPIQITVDVEAALAKLRAMAAATEDLTPVFAGPINQSIDEVFKKQFDTEGAAYGTKWRSLAPVTVALRKRRGHGRGGILRDTNRLWASFTKLGLGPDAYKDIGRHHIERGTTLPYGKYHQTGYTAKTFVVVGGKGRNIHPVALRRKTPKKVPARPIIPAPMPKQVTDGWAKMIADFITKGA